MPGPKVPHHMVSSFLMDVLNNFSDDSIFYQAAMI